MLTINGNTVTEANPDSASSPPINPITKDHFTRQAEPARVKFKFNEPLGLAQLWLEPKYKSIYSQF